MTSSNNNPTILVTGSSGNVGSSVVEELQKLKATFITGSYSAKTQKSDKVRRLDFTDKSSFEDALRGIKQVFLMRPPALSDVQKYFHPFLDKCKEMGVEHIVFLSLQGAENNSITPHHKIEKYIQEINLPYTFIRPSFFMQNLTTTHLEEVKEGRIYVPAGNGKTNFVDTRDIGAVVAKVLTEKDQHLNRAYEITGRESFTYQEIAEILTDKLGRKIEYQSPNPIAFLLNKVRSGTKLGFAIVMLALYSVARMGKADKATDDFEQLMGRPPITFNQFADDHLDVFGG
jgi:uncharacterized protein YbjT (DUF2867 family)